MLPSNLFLKLLFGTVAQKLSCEATPQGKTPNGIPGRCNVLLSHGGGLGRSLSYVGRSQISVPMMLHRSVMHKWPFPAASEAFAWNRRAKVAFQSYPAGLAWNCRAKVCKTCLLKLFSRLLHGTIVQELPFEAIA